MSKKSAKRDAAIRDVYSRVPNVACKGLCADACGPILMSRAERARIREHAGALPEPTGPRLECSFLKNGRCSHYDHRPLICRLYGAADGLPCPWGCTPAVGLVPDRYSTMLFRDIDRIQS
jgi:hypothetical protein